VVDDAGKVGVLVIDADRQLVLAAVEDAGGEGWRISVMRPL
jgi:hypothetical protein